MIVGNTCSEIGDVLLIEVQVSLPANYLQVNSYVETITGETGTRFFDKQFRASQDGLIWTDWQELTPANMATVEGTIINNEAYFQFRYERKGTDTTGLLEFISIELLGDVTIQQFFTPITDKSIFKGLSVGNFVTTQLCSNLLKKLYGRGIIPAYMDRGVSKEDDEDFIILWSTIAAYLSMFVTFMSKFDTMFMQRDLLLEYLLQEGINVCEYEELLVDLQYISEHLYDEIRKRGTKQIFLKKGEELNDWSLIPVSGEVIRMTCTDECDEFLWVLSDEKTAGWNVSNSSPIYRGNFKELGLIKGYEKKPGLWDINKYRLINPGNILINPGGTGSITASSTATGFGVSSLPTTNFSKGIVVSPHLDYEITVELSVQSGTLSSVLLDFGVDGFDCYNNNYQFIKIDGSGTSNKFFQGVNVTKTNSRYFLRGIVYRLGSSLLSFDDGKLSCGFGTNLKFISDKTNIIIPYFTVRGTGNLVTIHDFKIRPLRRNYSLGFLNTNNILQIWSYNNNLKRSFTDIKNTIRRFLIPYNTVLVHNRIRPLVTIPNDTIVYAHIDTSSMTATDQNNIRIALLGWWNNFRIANSDFKGSLLINTVNNSDISTDYAPGRGSKGVLSIAGSNMHSGTVEAWLQNTTEGLLRQGYKEGKSSFTNETQFLDYIQGKSIIVLSFIVETNAEYHGSAVNFVGQPTAAYSRDYTNFLKVRQKLKFFKGILYPITKTNVAVCNSFLLHSLSAIETKPLTSLQIDELFGPAKVAAYGPSNMNLHFYTKQPLNPYTYLSELKTSGWKGNFTILFSVSTYALSIEFVNELNDLLTSKVEYESDYD